MRYPSPAGMLVGTCVFASLHACAPARSPTSKAVAVLAPPPREEPVQKAGPGRERTSLDRGFRFTLGHATDPGRDFGHGTSYFSYLAKAGYGDGPADPNFD